MTKRKTEEVSGKGKKRRATPPSVGSDLSVSHFPADILNRLVEHVVHQDMESRVLWANKAAADSLGMKPDQMKGRLCYELWHDRTKPCEDCPIVRTRDTGKPHEGEVTSPDGREWLIRGFPVTNGGGEMTGVTEVTLELTHMKDLERSLGGDRGTMIKLVDSIPDTIYVKDLQSRFTLVNKAMLARFGQTSTARLMGKTDFDFFTRHHAQQAFADEQQIIVTGRPVIGKIEQETWPDGSNTWVSTTKMPLRDDSGKIVGTFGVSRDITEHKLAEELLRAQFSLSMALSDVMTLEEGLRVSLQAAVAVSGMDCGGIYLADEASRNMNLVSHQGLPDAFIANTSHFSPDTPQAGLIYEGKPVYEHYDRLKVPLRPAQQAEALRAIAIVPIRYEGKIVGCVNVASHTMDVISEAARRALESVANQIGHCVARLRAEEALRHTNMKLAEALDEVTKTQERMIQHERLSALGQMGSGIAHDFNNALMPIVGFTQFLLAHPETLDDKEGLKSTLTDINEAAVNAKEIVRRLSQFYKPATNGKRESVDLNHAIERAVALTKPIWREEKGGKGVPIEVRTKLGMNIPHVRGSEAELSEVLTNMILNSIDAMPQGGLVTISSTADDRHAILSVADTGMGMSEEVLRQCMEPFFSTKGEKGTGLGLSMVHGIVRRHRGNMEIRSLPGRGTTVELRLPVIFEAGDKKEHVVAVETVRSLKILVIDDDMWTRDLMKLLLEADNHEVDVAQTGTEGLTQFARQEYDLVMTDRAMPDMSGDQVAAAVKKVNPAMPVVLLTGFGDVMKDEGELPEGIDSILSKPVTQDELQHAIRSVIDPQGPPSEP